MAGKKGKYELEIMISGETDRSLAASVQKARKELDALERKAGLSSKGIEDSFGGMSIKGIDALSGAADRVFSTVVKGAKAAGLGIAAAFGASVMVGKDFEAQMGTVAAISQASEGEIEQLNAVAKEMGRTTKFSATEAGQGLEYMAMAGWKTKDMVSGLPGIMHLAASSGEELGLVSDIVTDAMTSFGLSADQSAHFADVLAQASSNSNTNVARMGETFKYVAPVAGAFGYSIEDVAIATGAMASAGVKGEQAGTAMRSMFTNLAKPTDSMLGYMKKLSVSLTASTGEMKPFRELLENLRGSFSTLTEAQKAEYAAGIAGQQGMSGLLSIINTSEEDFAKLVEAIDNSSGAAERMSEIRLDNLAGDVEILKSGLEGAGIEIYESFGGMLRSGVQNVTAWIGTFTENLQEDIPTIRREMRDFGQGVERMFGPLLSAGKWFLQHPAVLSGSIKGIAAALLTFKAAKGATAAVKLFGSLAGMVSAWPVAAAGLAIGGIVGIGSAIEKAANQRAAKNLAEHFGDITLSLEELNEAARHIVGDELFDSLDAFEEVSNVTSELKESLKKGLQEIDKFEWKVSLGVDLNESETQAYVTAVDNYVKNAQEYINNSSYELNIATKIIFGENADMSEDEAFYAELSRTVTALQNNLNENLADIAENGLTLPKERIVESYLDDIAEITQMITDAENAAKLQMIKGEFAGAALTSDTFQNLQQAIAEYTEEANAGQEEAYYTILRNLNTKRIAGEKGMEGGISQEVFEDKSAEATVEHYKKKAEIILNGYQAMEDTIMATYGSEIQPAMDIINQSLNESINEIFENPNISAPEDYVNALNVAIDKALSSTEISSDARGAIELLLKGMLPTEEQLNTLTAQIEQAGGEIPEAIRNAMTGMGTIGAVVGEEDDLWTIVGNQVANSPAHALLLTTVQQQSGQVPEAAIKRIESMYPDAEEAAKGFLDVMRNQFNEGFTTTVPINIKTIISSDQGTTAIGQLKKGALPGHAEGGIFDKPHIAEFAEEGPEAVVPLNGTKRAISIWQEAGKALGVYHQDSYIQQKQTIYGGTQGGSDRSSATSSAPVFSPIVNIYGNAEKGSVLSELKMSFEQFSEYMERYQSRIARVDF